MRKKEFIDNRLEQQQVKYWGTVLHRGSVCDSHPAVPGSNQNNKIEYKSFLMIEVSLNSSLTDVHPLEIMRQLKSRFFCDTKSQLRPET